MKDSGFAIGFSEMSSIRSIAYNEQMKIIRPALLQSSERAKQSLCVFLFRQPPNVKQKVLT